MSQKSETGPKITFVDLPELSETFVDSIRSVGVEKGIVRIEACVSRLEMPSTSASSQRMHYKQYPAARLVMPVDTVLDLHRQLNQIVQGMKVQGMIKPVGETPPDTMN